MKPVMRDDREPADAALSLRHDDEGGEQRTDRRPVLPPTWNSDCARPWRPPEASRATRDASGWKIAEPMPIRHGTDDQHIEMVSIGKRDQAAQVDSIADRQRKRHRPAVGDDADSGLQQ
jgi:hypothetical protein